MPARVEALLAKLGIRTSNTVDLAAAAGVIGILAIMIVRVPPTVLDGLLAINLSFSLVLLLVAFYIRQPLELSTFPSVLLLVTIFRLSLNVSSTKLILGASSASSITHKAGNVINFFGSVVAGNDAIVGFVIFLIIIIIQFIVITKGAGRVAEVAARFTLDAMPGKQMAIDADLNAGLISEDDARSRRTQIASEADFYGAMDGASKFVRGDAIAGIIITIINLIGGFLVGRFREGLELGEIFRTYTMLTIGDGLVSQIPALLVATTAGIVVTRATSEETLGAKLSRQILSQPSALIVAAVALGGIALVALTTSAKGLSFPFLLIAGAVGYSGRHLLHLQTRDEERKHEEEKEQAKPKPQAPEAVEKLLLVDPMEIEIGYALVVLVDTERGGDLLERVTSIRRSTALEMGLIVPPIRIRDNIQLPPNSYAIKIRGVVVAKGDLRPDRVLAMSPEGKIEDIPGIDTREPAFGLPAKWIRRSDRPRADIAGYNVIEPVAVLATHLTETIRGNAADILGRQEAQTLIDTLKETQPVVVEELIPELLSVGQVQKVLQSLLRERVPIRNLGTIVECLADNAKSTQDSVLLTELARASLQRVITRQYCDAEGTLSVMSFDPQLEQVLSGAVQKTDRGPFLALDPEATGKLLQGIAKAYEAALRAAGEPVLLTSPYLRPLVRRLVERALPRVAVLSHNEISSDAQVKSVGIVRMGSEDQEV